MKFFVISLPLFLLANTSYAYSCQHMGGDQWWLACEQKICGQGKTVGKVGQTAWNNAVVSCVLADQAVANQKAQDAAAAAAAAKLAQDQIDAANATAAQQAQLAAAAQVQLQAAQAAQAQAEDEARRQANTAAEERAKTAAAQQAAALAQQQATEYLQETADTAAQAAQAQAQARQSAQAAATAQAALVAEQTATENLLFGDSSTAGLSFLSQGYQTPVLPTVTSTGTGYVPYLGSWGTFENSYSPVSYTAPTTTASQSWWNWIFSSR